MSGTPIGAAGPVPTTGGTPRLVNAPVGGLKNWVVRRHAASVQGLSDRHGRGPTTTTPGATTSPPGQPGTTSAPTTAAPTTAAPTTAAPPTTSAPTTAAPVTTAAPPTTAAPATGLNSVARIEYSMAGPHEGQMQGVPTSWSWGSHPEVDDAIPGGGNGRFPYMTAWGQVYPDANATEPAQGSVRVEVKNMEAYVFSKSRHAWVRVQGTVQVGGAWFVDSWASSRTPDWRTEADGGVSVSMPTDGEFFHFWPSAGRGQLPIAQSDVGGVYTTYQARLIGAAAGTARLLANVGGDWWVDASSPNNGGTGPNGNNDQIGEGRFMYLSPNWSAIDFYTGGVYGPSAYPPAWPGSQLAASNPPLDAMGLP